MKITKLTTKNNRYLGLHSKYFRIIRCKSRWNNHFEIRIGSVKNGFRFYYDSTGTYFDIGIKFLKYSLYREYDFVNKTLNYYK
uniref:Uncharacterized protein n=1 Tax=viral metagenome TaxID=1070528 RepID=A0A6M3XTG1_9ZZZZ